MRRPVVVFALLLLAACGGGSTRSGIPAPDDAALLAFSEVHPSAGWIEIRSADSTDVALDGMQLEIVDGETWTLPAGSLATGEYRVFTPAVTLPVAGGVRLVDASGRTLDEIHWLENPIDQASYGETSAGTWQCLGTPTPGAANTDPAILVLINEFCPDNDSIYENPDAPGEYDDWIELYNAGDADVDLSGFTMTDDVSEPDEWTIPDGTVIPAGGFLMIHADKEDDTFGGTHAAFKLSSDGEAVALYAPDGDMIDAIAYGPTAEDRSRGRLEDGNASWVAFRGPTPDATNVGGVLDLLDDPAHRVRDPDYDTIYDTTTVRRFDIEMTADSYDAMRNDLAEQFPLPFHQRDFTYFECTVHMGGETWEHVGVRYKGNSSLTPYGQGREKLSLKLDFDEFEDTYPETTDQRFYGVKKLVLNNAFRDPSMVRELLCLELMRDLGAHASRASAVRVFLNGTYWGCYVNVEHVDKHFLRDRFDDDDGNLYKPEGEGAGLTHFVQETFVKKTNEDEADWGDIQDLIATLADPGGAIDAVFDVGTFLPWLAVNSVLCNLDSYACMLQNYYLYNDPDTGKFAFVPWDHNEAFGAFYAFHPPIFTPDDVHTFDILDPRIGDKPLIQRVLADPTWNQQYLDLVQQLLDGPLVEATIDARMDAWHDLMRPYVTGAEGEVYPYTLLFLPVEFDANLDNSVPPAGPHRTLGLREFLSNRRGYLETALP